MLRKANIESFKLPADLPPSRFTTSPINQLYHFCHDPYFTVDSTPVIALSENTQGNLNTHKPY